MIREFWRRLVDANRRSLVYAIFLGVMPVAFSTAVTAMAIRYEDQMAAFGTGEWTLFYAGASLTMAFGLTPTTFIALLSGFFGGWSVLPGVLVSYLAASLIGYGAAAAVDGGQLVPSLEHLTGRPGLIARLRRGEIMLIILARISPFLPFAVMNVLLAALRVDLRTFLVAGFVGMLPRTILFVWIGAGFGSIVTLLSEGGHVSIARIAVLLLLIASVAGFYFYFRRYVAGALREEALPDGNGGDVTGERDRK